MARALIRANAPLPGMPRGTEREIDLTDRDVKRAASGQISILRTWGEGVEGMEERVARATVDTVLGWVEAGEISAEEVVALEQAGKGRVGIIDRLTPAESGPGEPPAAAEDYAGVIGSGEGSEAAEGI